MTKEETIRVLQSIEDRAVDFPYMTACDWVAIAAAKRHLKDSLEVKEVELEKECDNWRHNHFHGRRDKEAIGEFLEEHLIMEIMFESFCEHIIFTLPF